MMTETSAILSIVAGCVALFVGLTGKQFYDYPGGARRIPRWQGQVIFVVVGAGFLIARLSYFYFRIFH